MTKNEKIQALDHGLNQTNGMIGELNNVLSKRLEDVKAQVIRLETVTQENLKRLILVQPKGRTIPDYRINELYETFRCLAAMVRTLEGKIKSQEEIQEARDHRVERVESAMIPFGATAARLSEHVLRSRCLEERIVELEQAGVPLKKTKADKIKPAGKRAKKR